MSYQQLNQQRRQARADVQEATIKEAALKESAKIAKQLAERDQSIWWKVKQQEKKIVDLVGLNDTVTGIVMTRDFIRKCIERHEKLVSTQAADRVPITGVTDMNIEGVILPPIALAGGGAPLKIDEKIKAQAMQDFLSSPAICEGTLTYEGINTLLIEATKKVKIAAGEMNENAIIEPYSNYIVRRFIADNGLEQHNTQKTRNDRDIAAINDAGNNLSMGVVGKTLFGNDQRDPNLMFNLDATTQLLGSTKNKPVFGMKGSKDALKKYNRSATRSLGKDFFGKLHIMIVLNINY